MGGAMPKATPASAGLTIKAYAKLRGQPPAIISRKLKQAGLKPPIDPAEADRLLDAATSVQLTRADGSRKKITVRGAEVSYNEAERRLRLAQAEQQELKLAKIKGTLVSREAAEREAFMMGRRVRDSLENLPARLSGLFAAESDQGRIFVLFSQEIQQCLESLTTAPDQTEPDSGGSVRNSRAKRRKRSATGRK